MKRMGGVAPHDLQSINKRVQFKVFFLPPRVSDSMADMAGTKYVKGIVQRKLWWAESGSIDNRYSIALVLGR
jgi:hypothetical protein